MSVDMKDSGVSWIEKVPKHWKIIPFKAFYSLSKGLSITKADLVEKGLPVISYGQIHSKINTGTKINDLLIRYVPESYLASNKSCIVNEGDIIFADTSEDLEGCGNCIYIDRNIELFAGYHTIIARNIRKEKNKYLSYLFQTDCWRWQIRANVNGVKLFSIPQKLLSTTDIILPPKEEQTRIANFLDKKCAEIDELIALQDQMIAQLTTYKQAVITETVTKGLDPNVKMKDLGVEWIGEIPEHWDCKRFWRVNYIRGRLGWKGLKAEEYQEDGYPFLSAFNIVRDKLDWSDINYITQKRYDESPEIKLSIGDLLIVKDGAGIGKCARVDNLPKGEATVNSSLAVITPSSSLSYKFEYYYLLSTPFQQVIWLLKIGMGVPHLTQENMRDIVLVCPKLEEQEAIAQYLDQKCKEIDELISVKKEKIEQLKAYKKSVIYEYVTGKKQVN